MACVHCNQPTNLSPLLCNACAYIALQVTETEPEKLVAIYRSLHKAANPFTQMLVNVLLEECLDEAEQRLLDPTDRMFNPRG